LASPATATLGPTPRRILDLDAGTTLPRAVHLVAAALVIAGIAATLLAARTGDASTAPAARIAPEIITVPALRPAWSIAHDSGSPVWPHGPAAALMSLAGILPDTGIPGDTDL
jgi:hypothetical protein